MELVKRLRARVVNGRLVLDEPTDLPEGTEVELTPAEDADTFDDIAPHERARLEAAVDESLEQAARGETLPIEETLRRLREPD